MLHHFAFHYIFIRAIDQSVHRVPWQIPRSLPGKSRSPVHDAGILESHWSRKCGFLHNTQEPRKEKAFHGTSSYLVFPSEHTRWLSHLQNQIWLMTSWLACAPRTLITLCVGNRRERTTPPSPPTTPTPPIEANFNKTRIENPQKNTTIFMKKYHLDVSFTKSQTFCSGLNMITHHIVTSCPGNAFRIDGPLWNLPAVGGFLSQRASDANL